MTIKLCSPILSCCRWPLPGRRARGPSSQGHESVAKSAGFALDRFFVVPMPPQLVSKLGAMPCRPALLAPNNTVIEPRLARQGQGDLGTSRTTSTTILTEEIDSIVPRETAM